MYSTNSQEGATQKSEYLIEPVAVGSLFIRTPRPETGLLPLVEIEAFLDRI